MAPGDEGLVNVIGLTVDPDRDRLWVCSSSVVWTVDPALKSLEILATEPRFGGVDRPTTSAIADGRLWVVNRQLDHFVPMFSDFGMPPTLAFGLVGVPLGRLDDG